MLCLKVTEELHTRPYMVRRRCVWTKHFHWVIHASFHNVSKYDKWLQKLVIVSLKIFLFLFCVLWPRKWISIGTVSILISWVQNIISSMNEIWKQWVWGIKIFLKKLTKFLVYLSIKCIVVPIKGLLNLRVFNIISKLHYTSLPDPGFSWGGRELPKWVC